MLCLEIEYLSKVSFSAEVTNNQSPEWPPHPDRVFQALIASSSTKTNQNNDESALCWLESQNPPDIHFPNVNKRAKFTSFVPVPDDLTKIINKNKKFIPGVDVRKGIVRKERFFPAIILPDNDPKIFMIWKDSTPSHAILDNLANLIKNVHRIGHSTSLVRMSIVDESKIISENAYVEDKNGDYYLRCPLSENAYVEDKNGDYYLRCPQKGRFQEIKSEFKENSKNKKWHPSIAPTSAYKNYTSEQIMSVMGNEWLVLSCIGNFVPELKTFPIIAKKMRDAIMSHINEPVHEIISGHNANSAKLEKPHLAIIPMANIGWKHSDGKLLGLAMVLPRISKFNTKERIQLLQAVGKFLNNHKSEGLLKLGSAGVLHLKEDEGIKLSMKSSRYTTKSKTWNSVTPVVLDRFPKKKINVEKILAQSCNNIGLPKPGLIKISRHSNISGVPSAYVSHDGWKMPKERLFAKKFICHAMLEFEEEVYGPVIIGAGRYYGLGLFLPGKRV